MPEEKPYTAYVTFSEYGRPQDNEEDDSPPVVVATVFKAYDTPEGILVKTVLREVLPDGMSRGEFLRRKCGINPMTVQVVELFTHYVHSGKPLRFERHVQNSGDDNNEA